MFAERMRCVSRMLAAQNRRLGRPLQDEDLADLAQETLLQLWNRLSDYQGRAKLESWAWSFCSLGLTARIRRLATDAARRRPMATAPEPDSRDPEPAEEHSGFESLVNHLSLREAQIVRLRHLGELEFQAIGRLLNVSTSTAKTHYYRAVNKLRTTLEATREENR